MRYDARRILVIATRQIGDVLLVTPLLRSLRRAYSDSCIDVLVYRHTGGMLEGNPDLDAMIEVDAHPELDAYQALLRRIWRRYDLAISTLPSDRPSIYAFLAAPRRVCVVPDLSLRACWKRWLASGWTLFDNQDTHTVIQNLRLADVLGIPRCYEVVPPSPPEAKERLESLLPFSPRAESYVLIHAFPMWRYKRLPLDTWRKLASHFHRRGFWVLLSGGTPAQERAYVHDLAQSLAPARVVDLAGQLSLGALAALLKSCRCYVGPDTAVTHLAAACGTPTLAIYGPTNPVKWGPWPAGRCLEQSPYTHRGSWQHHGNVLLLQGSAECVPCYHEGCERHKESYSRCLDELPTARVIAGVDSLLAEPAPSLA